MARGPTNGTTAWSIGAADGKHFAPSKSTFMVNYRVEDLAALLQSLRDEGCNVLEKMDDSETRWSEFPEPAPAFLSPRNLLREVSEWLPALQEPPSRPNGMSNAVTRRYSRVLFVQGWGNHSEEVSHELRLAASDHERHQASGWIL
jgi:hypothetical protein